MATMESCTSYVDGVAIANANSRSDNIFQLDLPLTSEDITD